jgi:hypothetical protein
MSDSSGLLAALAADPEIAPLLEFEPAPMQKRVNGWDPDSQRAFVALVAVTGSKDRAARAIGRRTGSLDRIFRRPDGAGFSAAVEAALAVAERRNGRDVARAVADAAAHRAQATSELPFAGAAEEAETRRAWSVPGIPADLQERDYREALEYERRAQLRWDESHRRVRDKIFMCRRVYLLSIADDPERRAAWELLCGPADWDAARELKRQPDEDREPVSVDELRTASWQVPLKTGFCVAITDAGRNLAANTLERLEQSIRKNDPRSPAFEAPQIPSPASGRGQGEGEDGGEADPE